MPSNVDLRIKIERIESLLNDINQIKSGLLDNKRVLDQLNNQLAKEKAALKDAIRERKKGNDVQKAAAQQEVLRAKAEIDAIKKAISLRKIESKEAIRGIEAKRLAVSNERLAYTKLAREIREADKAQQNLNKTNRVTATLVRQTWQYFSYAFGVYGMVRLLKNVTGEVLKFNAALKTTQAVTGATAREMEVLRESALNVVRRGSIFSPTTIAEAQTELAKLGLTATEISVAIKGVSDLAIATGEDMVKSGEIVTSVLRSWGLDASETGKIVDVMGAAFNASALDLTRLNEALKYIGPVARTVSWSFEDVVAVLSKLADSQIYGSLAGTSLRNILISLADANSNLSKMLGGTSTSLGDFLDRLSALDDAGLTTVLNTIEMRRALTAFNLVIQRREDIIAYRKELDDINGAIAEMAGTRMDSAISKTKQLQASWSLFWNTVFTSDTQLSNGLNALNEYLLNIEAVIRRYGGASGALATFLPEVQTIGRDIRVREIIAFNAAESARQKEVKSRTEYVQKIIKLNKEEIDAELERIQLKINALRYEAIQLRQGPVLNFGEVFARGSELDRQIEYWDKILEQIRNAVGKTDELSEETQKLKTAYERLTDSISGAWLQLRNEVMAMDENAYKTGRFIQVKQAEKDAIDDVSEALTRNIKRVKELGVAQISMTYTGGDGMTPPLYSEYMAGFWDKQYSIPETLPQRTGATVPEGGIAGEFSAFEQLLYFIEGNEDVILRTTDLFTNAFEDMASAVVSAIDRIVDRYDTMVGETQSALDTEMRLMEMGYANNVSAKQKELAELKALRAEALKDQAEAVRQQQLLESIAQGVNIASAASGILRTAGATGALGLLVAPGLLAALFALWRQAKVQAIQSAYPEFGEGGWITGASHKKGGVNINAEGGEFMVNKDEANRSEMTKKFLVAFNEGKIDIDRLLLERENIAVVDLDGSRNLNEMNKNIRKMAQGGRQYDHFGRYTIERSGIRTRKIYGS